MAQHPWREWAEASGADMTRMPGGQSRWSAGKDLSWEGPRFSHAAIFQRWRFDKRPEDCRYDQLEVTAPYELAKVFGHH